jgi:hypothetical protein
MQNRLPPEERRDILLHLANCDECSLEYALYSSMYEEIEETEKCPSHETLALLLEGKLPDDEKKDVLRHIAGCGDCAMACALADGMIETERRAQVGKLYKIVDYLSRFSKAAAAVLLLCAGFAGGLFYSGFRPDGRDFGVSEARFAKAVAEFESSRPYWDSLNEYIWRNELRIGSPKGVSGGQSEILVKPVADIWAGKKIFDLNLYKITELSGKNADAILSVEAVDIPSMTSRDIDAYASLLKNNRESEMKKAEGWIRLDQARYFSLAARLPADVWERYPVNEESFGILEWIASLPPNSRDHALRLSPEEAARSKSDIEPAR